MSEKISEIESYSFVVPTDIGCYFSGMGNELWVLPQECQFEQINEYITHPYYHQKELRSLAWWAYNTNGSVSAAVEYMKTMHTLDKVVVCKSRNASGKKPKTFEKNKKKMLSVLDCIKYKERIRDAILKRCNDGIYFYYFETTPVNANIYKRNLSDVEVANIVDINEIRTIETNGKDVGINIVALPVDYCKIVARFNNSFVIAFDLKYFTQFNEGELERRLQTFPLEIRKGWERYAKSNKTLSSWLVLDNNKTIVDKNKTPDNTPYGIPFAICALDDILYENYFTKTKRTVLDNVNREIFVLSYPEGKDKGKSSLTEKQQTNLYNSVKKVTGTKQKNGTACVALPAGAKLDYLNTDTSLLDEKNQSAIENAVPKALGFAAALLNGSDTGNYATAVLNFEMIAANVYSWIENFMNELNKCINANIIKDNKCVVDCNILPVTYIGREKFFEEMKSLYANCGGSLQAVVAASGMDVETYLALLDEEKENKFDEKYAPHQSMYTQSNKSGGRPSEDSNNPNTVKSRANNSNANPKPST